jgi:hypothetical protein
MKMFINGGKYDNDHKFMENFKLLCEYCDGLNISGLYFTTFSYCIPIFVYIVPWYITEI